MQLGEFLLRQLTFARVLVGDGGLTSLKVRTTCISYIPAIFEAHLNLFMSRKIWKLLKEEIFVHNYVLVKLNMRVIGVVRKTAKIQYGGHSHWKHAIAVLRF